ncbi:ChaN family lipoprotein [Vulgatibacter incomptus]|uniref:PDZ domain protein n=1 Tax=Vulgatibacter incomptus TaxID=1391653 RepID=A0A0K1P874_9BACT|nr:ChaN family lipoprotein [Vulgatibacter incomptus]AKU89710.1 PDZ domain protein [Vulgatibacter incomptus]
MLVGGREALSSLPMPRPLLVLALIALAAGCAHVRPKEGRKPGSLFTSSGKPIGLEALADGASDHRFLLVGELHDDPCAHVVQARLIAALAAAGAPPIVGLEMVPTELQPVLDRFTNGELTVSELSEALDWKGIWGFDFGLYQPIFEAAHRWQLPVVGLNLPKDVVRTVGREGIDALPPQQRALLPKILPPPPAQERMLREAFEAHAGALGSDASFQRFMTVQSLWDTQMASQAFAWSLRLDRSVVVLAGAGHVVQGWGIASRLRTLDPGASLLEIVPWHGEEPFDPAEGAIHYFCP